MKTLLTILMLCALSASGATLCVRLEATGAGTGANWTDALTSIANPVRGNTYYLADGNYGNMQWNPSGAIASEIIIKKARPSDHVTETGWNSAYGDGQAVFGSIQFYRGGMTLDGNGRTGLKSGYGIKTAGINVGINQQFACTNVTIRCIEQVGLNGAGVDNGFQIWPNLIANPQLYSRNITYSSNWCRDFWGPIRFYGTIDTIIEHSWVEHNFTSGPAHSEGIAMATYNEGTIIRYNVWYDITSTAWLTTPTDGHPGCAGALHRRIKMYGNVFHGTARTTGDGVYTIFDHRGVDGIWFVNNTIINCNRPYVWANGSATGPGCIDTFYIQNNIWYDDTAMTDGMGNPVIVQIQNQNPPSRVGTLVTSHNAYFGQAHVDSDATKQVGSGNPFVNYPANNYALTAPTAAGVDLAGDEFDFDMFGNRRGADGTWDRGAIEFGGVADTTPPVNSAISTNSITTTAANVTWTTSEGARGIVDYGTTASYGGAVTNNSINSSQFVSLSGLTGSTLYHFRVRSIDVAGNASTPSVDSTFTTAAVDSTPPTVTLTAPTNGALVSATVAMTATASDNVLVSHVVFYVSGQQIDTDHTSPYSASWNTFSVPNGPAYQVYAMVNDASGNTAWSATNTVAVTNTSTLPTPVAHWQFTEGAGTTANDSIGTNDLTLRNGTSWTSGHADFALMFDGISNYADAPNSPEVDITGTTMSVGCWVNLTRRGQWIDFVVKPRQVGAFVFPYYAWHIYGGDASANTWRPFFQLYNTASNAPYCDGMTEVTYGEWAHVVGTYDGSNIKLYLNGELKDTVVQTGNMATWPTPIMVGAHGGPGQFMQGKIDDVRLFNVALTADQVGEWYVESEPPPDPPPPPPPPPPPSPSASSGVEGVRNITLILE